MRKMLTKNRKGQVFLLLSIVILIYLVLLSTTVYKITQTPYINPAPNQQQIIYYVENSISSIEDLAEMAISRFSNGMDFTSAQTLVENGLEDIESFLDNHNLPSTISYDNTTFSLTNSSTLVNPVFIQCQLDVTIHIESPDFYYDGSFTFDVEYYMEISEIIGTENYISIYKVNNGYKSMINDATLSIEPITSITNMLDGRYEVDLQSGQIISATLPGNILLWLEVV